MSKVVGIQDQIDLLQKRADEIKAEELAERMKALKSRIATQGVAVAWQQSNYQIFFPNSCNSAATTPSKESTMSNLTDIQNQIAALQKQADEIKAQEFAATVSEIKSKMAAYGITMADLAAVKTRSVKGSKNPVAAKYRGPNGEEWTGRGMTPRWLSAQVEAGASKESFLIA